MTKRKSYDKEFKLYAVKLVEEKGQKVSETARELDLAEQGLTPHHLDDRTIQLIPTKLHGNIPHIGSASDLRGGY